MIVRYYSGRSNKSGRALIILLILAALAAFGSLAPGVKAQTDPRENKRSDTFLLPGSAGVGRAALLHSPPPVLPASNPETKRATESRGPSETAEGQSGQDARAPGAENKQATTFRYPTCSETMHRYFLQRYTLTMVAPIYSAGMLIWLLHAGAFSWLKGRYKHLSAYPARLFCFAAAFYAIAFLIRLPLVFYSSYLLEQQFGLSHQLPSAWAADEVRQFFVGSLVIPLITACFLILRKYQHGWHFPVWLLISATLAVVVFLEPLAVDPMFNKFTALPEGSLKIKIEQLCRKAGLSQPSILVADKSKQTTKINAYVSGFSASNRIVLFDNLTESTPETQILAVVAHELGHYRLKHVLTGLALSIVGLYPLIYLAEKATDKFLPLLPRRWGIKSNSDPAFIVIWCLVIWITPLFIAPLESFFSRLLEAEADAYAIRLTADPLSAARLFSTLSRVNLSDPDPPAFIEFWFFSHPSIKHRIDYALTQLKKEEN